MVAFGVPFLFMACSCFIRGAPRGPVGSRLPDPASTACQRRGRAAVLLVASAANTDRVLRRECHLHPLVAGGDRPADEVRTWNQAPPETTAQARNTEKPGAPPLPR